jgi:hypothetical protein
MLQGRNPEWAFRPFFARYSEHATWLDELRPAFGEDRFFFEQDPEWSSLFEPSTQDDSDQLQDERSW